ncbi:helix-turn-helix transcriptional regulator [Chryseobacterium salipaludis]|uniref:helix-turn-helix domain-containing protein n=1 Tax=Chryseobacterium TaxID=59732 RepID=UPI001FF5135D|nr:MULTISPECIES: helix-turn-helix transcriptional regulator [Chryseobacterium]MCJ8498612.1 helix-turn-helix transcriptional regulator [Chryseobacterium salipaludis]MCX3297738.1 helix-turn-helix transcriptional regulator [Planobacterium sp. JC490]
MYKWNPIDVLKQMGIIIHVNRLRKKISQQDLANEIELSINHIGRIEKGEANLTTANVIKICNFLEINPMLLFEKLSSVELKNLQDEIITLKKEFKIRRKNYE